jgi:hypothetical protein
MTPGEVVTAHLKETIVDVVDVDSAPQLVWPPHSGCASRVVQAL